MLWPPGLPGGQFYNGHDGVLKSRLLHGDAHYGVPSHPLSLQTGLILAHRFTHPKTLCCLIVLHIKAHLSETLSEVLYI